MKSVYHAAAVISSNFPVVLEAVAASLMTDVGIPERSAQQAVHALVEAAISNTAGAPAEEVLTGPVFEEMPIPCIDIYRRCVTIRRRGLLSAIVVCGVGDCAR